MSAAQILRLLSIDHGAHDLEPMARAAGADPARLPAFKRLAVAAASDVAAGRAGYGMFLDGALGADALSDAAASGLWLARQYPHGLDRPPAAELAGWGRGEVVKLIANGRADARTPLAARLPEVLRVAEACRQSGRSMLVEALPGAGETTAQFISRLAARGLAPDWWLVEAQPSPAAWAEAAAAATAAVPCRGLIMIARTADVAADFAAGGTTPLVRGFVGGRSIFGPPLTQWLAGTLDDAAARSEVARRYGAMCEAWDTSRKDGTR